jgi:hypothetical protein
MQFRNSLERARRDSLSLVKAFLFSLRGVQREHFSFQRKRSESMKADELLISGKGLLARSRLPIAHKGSISALAILRRLRRPAVACGNRTSTVTELSHVRFTSFSRITGNPEIERQLAIPAFTGWLVPGPRYFRAFDAARATIGRENASQGHIGKLRYYFFVNAERMDSAREIDCEFA